MPSFKVTYLEPVPGDVEEIIRSCLPPELTLRVRCQGEKVEEVVADADFILVATTPLPAHAITEATQLRLIQHQGVGYEKTDAVAAAQRSIPVALCPSGTSVGVAEHVFLLILALYKRLLAADASMRQGKWLQWELRPNSFEIAGKTFGILGLGRVGKEVARRARAVDAQVAYFDVQRPTGENEQSLGVRFLPLDDLLAQSDILSLHLPYVSQNRHSIGAAELAKMKPSAILINTARGPLIDEESLVDALEKGRLAGAGLDVFEREPLLAGHPLIRLPNVVLTPHISAGTVDALRTKMSACFANMLRVGRGDPPIDVVNL
jgi:phosphoglycerate dehydrogenase-like enzyme